MVASFMIIHTKDDCRRNQERIEDEGEERRGGIERHAQTSPLLPVPNRVQQHIGFEVERLVAERGRTRERDTNEGVGVVS